MKKTVLGHWRANFLTGLVIILPALISIVVIAWLFTTISDFTDKLLFFLPKTITHKDQGLGPIYWHWSAVALLVAVIIICVVGLIGRYYFGKKIIEWVEDIFMRVPGLNKIYGAIKQVDDAFASGNKNSFKTVVLVEYPRHGIYSIGFITTEQHDEVQAKTKEKVVCIYIPTTPNPTAGFLILVPEDKVTKLDMSVSAGIKYVISLGSISPEFEATDKKLKA